MNDHGRGILGNPDATADEIGEAMGHAFREALREHKRRGVRVATWDWENGRVVIIPPEEIVLPGETAEVEAEGNARGE